MSYFSFFSLLWAMSLVCIFYGVSISWFWAGDRKWEGQWKCESEEN